MNDEAPFLDALRADPADATALLVYADWLEERGDRRAEYIRLALAPEGKEAEIETLKRQLPPAWVAMMEECRTKARTLHQAAVRRIETDWCEERFRLAAGLIPGNGPRLQPLWKHFFMLFVSLYVVILGFFSLWLAHTGRVTGTRYVFHLGGGIFLLLVGIANPIHDIYREIRYRRAWRAYQDRRARILSNATQNRPLAR